MKIYEECYNANLLHVGKNSDVAGGLCLLSGRTEHGKLSHGEALGIGVELVHEGVHLVFVSVGELDGFAPSGLGVGSHHVAKSVVLGPVDGSVLVSVGSLPGGHELLFGLLRVGGSPLILLRDVVSGEASGFSQSLHLFHHGQEDIIVLLVCESSHLFNSIIKIGELLLLKLFLYEN